MATPGVYVMYANTMQFNAFSIQRRLLAGNFFTISDLLLGRRRVQRAVQLRRLPHPHLPRPLRALRPLPHRPGVLQPRLARLPGVPRSLPLLLGPLHLHEAAAWGVHSAR